MSSNLVIAAIPDENDRVWKISSEKIPHLTLLFLGDSEKVANLEQIMQFVEHAASTSLRRFYLPVDRRGELGADKADVLFFKKGRYDFKAVYDFRSLLLKDENIKTAYDATSQFEAPEQVGLPGQPWIPHLTLGYPDTPAKPMDDNESFQFFDVQFNKIAVWTGDFEGPDFLLKDYWDDMDEVMDSVPMDISMSDLEHVGVKGMHWGVRKEQVGGGAKAVGRAAMATGGKVGKAAKGASRFAKDVNFEARTVPGDSGRSTARNMVVGAAAKPYRKEDLPALKARHGDYAKLTNRAKKPFSKEAKAYRKDARETYVKRLETTANSMTNASGNRQYTVRERGIDLPAQGGNLPSSKHYWEVTSRAIKHAEDAPLTLELIMEDGYIVDLKPVENTLAQTEDLGIEFLEHFGIKGMRWGVRSGRAVTTQTHIDQGILKRQTKVQVKGGHAQEAHPDAIKAAIQKQKLKKSGTAALSTQELRDLANRLQVEGQVNAMIKGKGQRFVEGELTSKQSKAAGRAAAGKAAPHVFKKAKKTAATAAVAALL